MSVDTVQSALIVQAVHPKQDADGQAGRDTRRDSKTRQVKPEEEETQDLFLNALGQVTGGTINTIA